MSPVTENRTQLERTLKITVEELASQNPSLDLSARAVIETVCNKLGLTCEQMKPHLDDMVIVAGFHLKKWQFEQTMRSKVISAGPTVYMRVACATPWHTLSVRMQDSISQLCAAIEADKIKDDFIRTYMEGMASAHDPSPQPPRLARIGYGALQHICSSMKVQPPDVYSKTELDNARRRLSEVTDDRPFILRQHLCDLALGDLQWLMALKSSPGGLPVLGNGSVVTSSASFKVPLIIVRPTVWHNYDPVTSTLSRELVYNTTIPMSVKASDIAETLAKTEWPMSRPVAFEWKGSSSPYNLQTQALRDQAKMRLVVL